MKNQESRIKKPTLARALTPTAFPPSAFGLLPFRSLLLCSVILLLSAFCLRAQWTSVGDGIEYQEFTAAGPNNLFVARMVRNNTNATIDTTIALDTISGAVETVKKQSSRRDDAISWWGGNWGARNDVVVAINGGFYTPATGVITGGQIQGGWYSHFFADSFSGFAWKTDRTPFIGECVVHQTTKVYVKFQANSNTQPIDGINRAPGTSDLVIFTPQYNSQTPSGTRTEVLVEMTQPNLTTTGTVYSSGIIRSVAQNTGSTWIPFDHLVLSADGSDGTTLANNASVGAEVRIFQQLVEKNEPDEQGNNACQTNSGRDWANTFSAINVNWHFLKNNVVRVPDTNAHPGYVGYAILNPRTAICYNSTHVFFVICDGRSAQSIGMSCETLGNWAKTVLGATDGVNLDGGGSSTMVVNGVVKNDPSDGSERAVCNGVVMVNLQPKITSTAFTNGQTVTTTGSASLRLGPGTNYFSLATVANGAQGTVGSHSINGVYAKGNYWWKCNFSGTVGWIAESLLNVPPSGPAITQQPANQTVAPGDTAAFNVTATGTGTLYYRWQRGSTNVNEGVHYSGATAATLTVSNCDSNDMGNYRCLVTNAYGSATSSLATLTVSSASCTPGVLQNAGFEGGNSGGVATNWTGYQRAPNPTTVWSIETASPAEGSQYQQIANTSSTGGGGVRQNITGCTIGAAYNVAGWMRGNSASATCTVKVSPAASTDWSTAADLNPPQSYSGSTWTAFSGSVVATGTNMTLWLDGQTSGVELNKAECFDAVTVTCSSGPQPPPAPSASAASGVSSNGFTANWSSASGAGGYRLDVGTNSWFTGFLAGYEDLDVGNVLSRVVSGLSEATIYYYRVRAYNGAGTSGNSETVSVTTSSAGGPPPAPVASAASGVTNGGFTANWNSASGASGYRLDVSTNGGFSGLVAGYGDLDVGNVLSWVVSGLETNVTHYYRVRAYNGNGTSGDSATITVEPPGPPLSGDPTNMLIWAGRTNDNQFWHDPTNWVGNVAPAAGSSNIVVFRGDIRVPYNWPHIMTNYGTTILIFSNDVRLNGIKILGGSNNTVNLGSYVLNDQPPDAESPSYFGIDGPIEISYQQTSYWVTNYNFTNALGDASVGGQTDFKCVGARLDVYGQLRDGAGANSKLVKSGERTLNLTGQWPNTYSGGTVVNAGPIKMQKPAGFAAIPGDVTVHGTGGLIINVVGGEQIANSAIVTLNDSGYFDLINQPETVQTVQSTSAGASILNIGTLTVAPATNVVYNGALGESAFAGSVSGTGTVQMNGTGTYGMLGVNSVASLVVNSGTLKINGNSGTGAVTVNSGGTLLGKDTIAGAVTVASGGTIGVGVNAGHLTLSAGLNLSAVGNGATNVWELAALTDDTNGVPGTDFDQIVVTGGTLALGSSATLDLRFIGSATAPDVSEPFWQTAHSWTIVALNGGTNAGASNFGRLKNASYPAGDFTAAVDGSGNIVLTFAPPVEIPAITQQPSVQNVCPGATATFNVAASGEGTLTYQWQTNGVNLSDNSHYGGCANNTLWVTNAGSADAVAYRCVVSNAGGITNSAAASLTLKAATTITQPPSTQAVWPGSNVTFSVSATGEGVLTYQWQTNGVNITNDSHYAGCTTATLWVTNVSGGDTTAYRCVVSGGCGSVASTSATLSLLTGGFFSADYPVNRAVPDGGFIGISDTRTVSTALHSITNLKVRLKVSGTYNGDLFCYLTHSSGYSVLLNRVGRSSSNPFGYGDPGLEVTFDDGATNDVHTYRQVVTGNESTSLGTNLMGGWVADGRTNRPTVVLDTDGRPALLNVFNGLDPNGSWTIFLADLVGGDSHKLVSWGLEIMGTEEPTAPPGATITGIVKLQAYLGTNRFVQFITSSVADGVTNYLQTNDMNLSFTAGEAQYSIDVPTNVTHVSVKTAWHLRKRQAVMWVGGVATNDFTGTEWLLGGDLVTAIGSTNIEDTDNLVNAVDLGLLLGYYLNAVGSEAMVGRADIDGDAAVDVVNAVDLSVLLGNYLVSGDGP